MLETISSSGQTIRARKITSWLKYLQRVCPGWDVHFFKKHK